MAGVISDSVYRAFREERRLAWRAVNAPCALCGQDDIDYDGPPFNRNDPATAKSCEMDHKISRKRAPHLALEPSNAQPSHALCNRNKGSGDARAGIGVRSEEW
jgi:5-methylcytosine-specific restriction endonuclease McrA